MRKTSWIPGLVAALTLLAGTVAVRATETQWWPSDAAADYVRAEMRGVTVRADGAIEAGPEAAAFPDDSLRLAWAVAVLADGSVAVGGDHGRIDRWTPGQGLRPWVKLGGGQVFCLAREGDALLAGTGPDGAIWRIGARGDTTRVATTGERYVWALVPGAPGTVWAATGTRGRLFRVSGGKATLVFDSDESNLLCALTDGAGGVWTGGDSRGRVYHTTGGGVTTTELDAAEDEVRALARGADGALYAAALSASATSSDDGADDDEKPAPARASTSAGRAVVYRFVPDSAAVAWWTSPQPLVFAMAGGPDGVLAATGNRAGLYRIERIGGAAALLAPPQGQVTALARASDGTTWAVTSNPVALWRLGPRRASGGTLTSATLDARRRSRFGRARWHASGPVRILTRSGNCDPPDTTWSAWQAVAPEEDGGRVLSPGARWLQWRAELGSPDSRLDDMAIAWREDNLAPRVDDVSVAAQALAFREGEIIPRSEAVTQSLPGGQKVEYSMSVSSARPIRELPVWARGLRTLTWKATDPNGDALKYRVELRSEPGGNWIEIGKDLEAALYTWNTVTIPDGRYRLRVIASDAPGNAVGEERTGSGTSAVFTVDNTPPAIGDLAAAGARVSGEASDATSPIWRLEVSVDDADWRMLSPVGGIADARRVRFDVSLPDLKPGDHVASVRAIDLAGNSTTRAVALHVGAAR